MAARDTSKPGPVANFVFAGFWLALGIWAIATPSLSLSDWLQLAGHIVLAAAFVGLGLRQLHARKVGGPTT